MKQRLGRDERGEGGLVDARVSLLSGSWRQGGHSEPPSELLTSLSSFAQCHLGM